MAKTTTQEGQVRGETNEERPTREACTDGHPMEDDPTNQTPIPLDWAKDINESHGVRPVVSMDTRPTEYVDKATIPPPFHMALVTSQPSARPHETRGALSAATTIATTVPSHHATP